MEDWRDEGGSLRRVVLILMALPIRVSSYA